MTSSMFQLILMAVVTAATPLILAAIGELVTERAGVLNLGVEGMMIMGAAVGFAGAYSTGSTTLGALAGVLAGALMAALFGFLTIALAINQVAAGLALTIFGVGLSGLLGAGFVGLKRDNPGQVHIPGLSDLPYVGQLIFGEDPFVYVTLAIVAGTAWFLSRTRAGLTLRSIGDNHHSAHTLGLPGNPCAWFWGPCSLGARRSCNSTPRRRPLGCRANFCRRRHILPPFLRFCC